MQKNVTVPTCYIDYILCFSHSRFVLDLTLIGPTVTRANGPLKDELLSKPRHPVRQRSSFPAGNQKKHVTVGLQRCNKEVKHADARDSLIETIALTHKMEGVWSSNHGAGNIQISNDICSHATGKRNDWFASRKWST